MSEDDGIEVTLDDSVFAGVWANDVWIASRPDEFTLDFIRWDPREPRGAIVARVAMSPRLMRQLLDDGERSWQTWSESTLPPEVRGDDAE